MNLKELTTAVADEMPEMGAAKVRAVLTSAFAKLQAELAAAEDGKVVTPLGAVRIATKKKTGEDGAEENRRRLSLVLAKPEDPAKAAERAARQAERKAERKAAKTAK